MSEVGLGVRGSPDSDCNSNHQGSASYLSNTSSQDIDFIQDNSDYQWFLDYGYRDGVTNHHTSILSLPESYEAQDLNYYDVLAKNMDANLAEADMESFRTEDIHALLTTLPPMCQDQLSQDTNRQGECYASVSGSLLEKFELEGSLSPQNSEDTSMSICKSELLFSPVKEVPVPGVNFSVDSLDCDLHDIMLTCQANKDNYTIAFEGSVTMYSEDSDYHESSDKSSSTHWPTNQTLHKLMDTSMTQSDSGSLTTWSKLKKRSSDNQIKRRPSGNNNNSGDDASHLGLTESSNKSHSMPNLYKQKLKNLTLSGFNNTNSNSSSEVCTVKRRPVKVFDIQHQIQSSSLSDMATSVDVSSNSDNLINNKQQQHANFSLFKLFMKQKSMSNEGMSTTLDQLSSSENWPDQNLLENSAEKTDTSSVRTYDLIAEEPEEDSRSEPLEESSGSCNNNNKLKQEVTTRSIQTSQFSEITNLKNAMKINPQPPVKIMEANSFLNKLKQEGEVHKPVYVLYPDYVLPNLDFLNEKQEELNRVLLMPQKAPKVQEAKTKRPFSCNDLEVLKQRGFNHVKDWESLNFLLPQEYRKILTEPKQLKNKYSKKRPISCDLTNSSSSNSTQPSSGYRGSSSVSSDSNSPAGATLNPLFVYRYDSVTSSEASVLSERNKPITTTAPTPPRPPLPRGILRKEPRYTLNETSEEELAKYSFRRKSLQDPYYQIRAKRFSETEDEGVDAGTSSSSMDENVIESLETSDLAQLEEYLKLSGISNEEDHIHNEESLLHLRSYVSKFLALKINQEGAEHFNGKKSVSFAEKVNVLPKIPGPNNSPNVSAFLHQKHYKNLTDMPICEENEASPTYCSPVHHVSTTKDSLFQAVTDSVEQIIKEFSSATSQSQLNDLGDSSTNPACAKLVLTKLCPALYAVLSDGLKPCLETSFGAIGNSVWQVVEASAQQGPLTKALNDLVMRINSEDCITEGLVKFNAFVFGLLNVRSLDAWASYLRTRESVLKKHYDEGILVLSHTGGASVRILLDQMIGALKRLALLPFQLDLLFEYRELHASFKRMDSFQQPPSPIKHSPVNYKQFPLRKEEELPDILSSSLKAQKRERPRSCVDPTNKPNFKLGEDVVKKRWSGIALNSKLYQAFDRLAKEEEDYTDSLESPPQQTEEPESLDSNFSDEKPLNGRRFKKLQQKWEMLSGKESSTESPPTSPTHTTKSKIPRPILSPNRPSGIPVPMKKPLIVVPQATNNDKKLGLTTTRTSRMDTQDVPRTTQRPSSLPYKPTPSSGKNTKITPPRRAVSSSLSRKPLSKAPLPKVVRTLNHRVPSESGHLPYNEGERLKVVLEVDEKWLLCCRGTQKGLVPRSAVIAADSSRF